MFNQYYGCRTFTHDIFIEDGKITINEKRGVKTIVRVVDKQVVEKKVTSKGKYFYWIKYGEFEKERSSGTTTKILRFRNNTGKGKDGLCIRKDIKLVGQEGTCYTFFCRGRLLWQKYVYSNKVVAYHLRHNHSKVVGVRPDKTKLFEIEGEKLNFKRNREGEPFIYDAYSYGNNIAYNFSETKCSYTLYDKEGKIKEKGNYENKQRVGEWIENYKTYFFINGVEVEKKLYEMPSEKINPQRVLNEKNAQVRAMLLKKIGLERVVKKCKGKLIHKYRDMKLYDFPMKSKPDRYNDYNTMVTKEEYLYDEKHLRILQVVCPTTKNKYFLRIPALPDWNTCERARQGTFNGFDSDLKELKFKKET